MYCSGRPDESKFISVQATSIEGLSGPDADDHKGPDADDHRERQTVVTALRELQSSREFSREQ